METSMNNQKWFDHLLRKNVGRREFLSYLGTVGLGLAGVMGLAKSLSPARPVTQGYGAMAYGGAPANPRPRQTT
jgi:hypothetical protein